MRASSKKKERKNVAEYMPWLNHFSAHTKIYDGENQSKKARQNMCN